MKCHVYSLDKVCGATRLHVSLSVPQNADRLKLSPGVPYSIVLFLFEWQRVNSGQSTGKHPSSSGSKAASVYQLVFFVRAFLHLSAHGCEVQEGRAMPGDS